MKLFTNFYSRTRHTYVMAAVVALLSACTSLGTAEDHNSNRLEPNLKRFETTYLLEVKDEFLYDEYRKDIEPILARYGVTIRYDFSISKTYITEANQRTNRVFLADFKSKEIMNQFFSDPSYQIAKKKLEKSVSSFHVISHQ